MLNGVAWTRRFVTGPMDSRWNPHQFCCQFFRGNFSIYGHGAKEILCQLRKDQGWRYEHLAVADSITKTIHHQVRDGKGQILEPKDLRRECNSFNSAEFVDFG